MNNKYLIRKIVAAKNITQALKREKDAEIEAVEKLFEKPEGTVPPKKIGFKE